MPRLLVVDDSESICWGIAELARDIGFQVDTASSAEESLTLVAESKPDVICLDVRLPGMDGLDAMAKLRPIVGDIPIIVMTAYGDLETAVRAVRNGAFDYV
ncbi:MAG: response regulator, partial [Planctomycetota bacterium]